MKRNNKKSSRHLVEDLVIRHASFDYAVQRLQQCFNYSTISRRPPCLAILSESHSGKTEVLLDLVDRHPQLRSEDGLLNTIVMVETPAIPTIKGIAEIILDELGDPLAAKGTEVQTTKRIVQLFKNTGTRMLIIDEFQHFVDMRTDRVVHDVANWLKGLLNRTKVSIVVSGLESSRRVFDEHEQLRGRFKSRVSLPRFDWLDDNDRADFLGILIGFEQELKKAFNVPSFSSEEFSIRLYAACGGLIGYLVDLLTQLNWNACDEGKSTLTCEDFRRV